MRTTIFINIVLLNKMKRASETVGISKNELVSILLSRFIYSNGFEPKPYKTVKYQDSYPEIVWKRDHIDLDPVLYEKVLDLRRNFKYSVSWIISFTIMNYLDKIVKKIINPENNKNIMDNYPSNFVYISKMLGGIHVFITMLGLPEKKYLQKLLS